MNHFNNTANLFKTSPFSGVAVGVFIAVVGTHLLGYTSAMVIPNALFHWTKTTGSVLGLITWDFLVVQLLGVGVLAALVTYLLAQYSTAKWIWLCSLVVFGELVYMWVISPLISKQTIIFAQLSWWQHSHTIVVLLSVFVAGYAAHMKKKG